MLDFLIHSPVEHYARVAPDRPALSFRGDSLTYLQLDQRSNQLARALIDRGLRPQQRVGIFMHKSLELGVAIYGVLKAGGVFVPLDPFMPSQRLAFIIEDCGIEHVVTANNKLPICEELEPDNKLTLYGVSQPTSLPAISWDHLSEYEITSPNVPIIDQDLGYIMYTSGSTGFPKGMMHTHHGSISYARWGALHVRLQACDRVASHAPLHFDLSVFDFFSTAQAGATVSLVPEPVTKLAASWTQYIEDEGISVLFTVPFTLIEMLQRGAMENRDLSSLRWILYGGEPFPPKHLRALMLALPEVAFTNVYGPAEAPSCTCYDVQAIAEGDESPIPIGVVSRNSQDLILDDDDQPCGLNVPGELLIRSSTLTKGYWNRPDLNAKVFYLQPSDGPFPHVYFRTGDMVERHEDGLLRFLGRKDRMVKTRGHRVELDEVESVLARSSIVLEAAVYAVKDDSESQEIRAAVTLHEGAQGSESLLKKFAGTMLPSYAVPRRIRVEESLPRTSSGKVDRLRLAELDRD